MDKKTKIIFNILAVVSIIIFSFAIAPKTLQNDTYYTISTGQHIIENGIDGKDAFSWHDLKYTYPHWLYDTAIYLVYSWGGMTGIYISTIVLSCILGLMLYVTNVKINKNNLFSFILTMAVMALMRSFIAARAQLVTFILFVTEILFIECFLDTKKKRYAIGLMIISCLIANLHAAVFYVFFIFFMPYIAEYLIIVLRDSNFFFKSKIKIIKHRIERLSKKEDNAEKLAKLQEKLLKEEEKSRKYEETNKKRAENPYKIKLVRRDAAKWLILIAILCLLTGLLTPIGNEPYTHIFKLMSGNTTESISEHQPLVLWQNNGAAISLVMLLAILIFTDTKISLKDLFMLLGLIILTFMSRRQFSLLLIIGVFSLTRLICDFVNKYDKNGVKEFTEIMITLPGKFITILLVVLCSYVFFKDTINADYIDSKNYPIEAANYILEKQDEGVLDLTKAKLYNDYNYGSYLLYRGIPVFIDSRADLYSPEFNPGCNVFSDYMNISGITTYYEDKFEEYGITHVITYENSRLAMLISKDDNYKQLYKDDNFVFYERLNAGEDAGEE